MKTRAASSSLAASTLHFATDGSYFVSGGAKHLKQWTIGGPRARSSGMTTNPGMDGRPIKWEVRKRVCLSLCRLQPPQKNRLLELLHVMPFML
jgi:hypothetical protein